MPMEKEVLTALSVLLGHMTKETPELVAVMNRVKSGELSEFDAMQEMMNLVKDTPGLEERLMRQARTDFEATRDASTAPLVQMPAGPTGELGDPNQLFYSRPDGMPKLNPLYVGRLIERLQFDEDAPELRTGPMDPRVNPAVAVDSDARSPAVLGRMMQRAGRELKEELERHETERRQKVNAIAEGRGTPADLALMQQHSELVAQHGADRAKDMMLWGSPETDHPEYQRGSVPQLRVVAAPTGSEMLSLSKLESQDAAWKMISSTQGRRSALGTIRVIIVQELLKKGVKVRWREIDKNTPKEMIVAARQWKVNLSGARSINEGFALVDTAGKALASGLIQELGDPPVVNDAILELTTLDLIDKREVGWAVRLVRTHPVKELEDANAH